MKTGGVTLIKAARDGVGRLAGTPEYRQSRRERKKIGMLFAHLKRILGRPDIMSLNSASPHAVPCAS
jgi:hypothetical protein